MSSMKNQISNIFTIRNDFSYKNVRSNKWAAILIFPLAYIIYHVCHFSIETSFSNIETYDFVSAVLGWGSTAVIIFYLIIAFCGAKKKNTDIEPRTFDYTIHEHAVDVPDTEDVESIEQFGLSPREKEIFLLLLGDSQRKHIADTLNIGNGTVNFHVNNLYKKLGIQSRIELFAKYGRKSS
jgi:DNA-binding CsgD family transcriptional regulator